MKNRSVPLLSFALLAVLGLAACQSSSEEGGGEPLVIYSGRSEALADSLVAMYRQQTGRPVRVRYGKDAQLLAALREEGDASPADVYWGNTAGALGEADGAGLLATLPDSILQRPARFVPQSGRWVPGSIRLRVLAYNPGRVDTSALPSSVLDIPTLDQFKGRVGWTPPYSSFQDFVTALRVLHGRDTTQAWLEGMQKLRPRSYSSNVPMIRDIASGEIDIGLTNHYYLLQMKYGGAEGEYEGEEEEEEEEHEEEEEREANPSLPVEMYHFAPGDVGNLALATGPALLRTNDHKKAALRFISFILSQRAQRFTARRVKEYPVVPGVQLPPHMISFDRAISLSPSFDMGRLQHLDATLKLLRQTGAL